jgi:hypothetical protein
VRDEKESDSIRNACGGGVDTLSFLLSLKFSVNVTTLFALVLMCDLFYIALLLLPPSVAAAAAALLQNQSYKILLCHRTRRDDFLFLL